MGHLRLRILSDLHLETGPWKWESAGEDVVILAGDIADQSIEGQERRKQLWGDLARARIPTIYVLGNHEGYADWVPRDVLRRCIESELPPNIHLLDRETLSFKGVRFLGCSLWTDFSVTDSAPLPSLSNERTSIMRDAESIISDFKYLCRSVQYPPERITSLDMALWHHADRSWLTTEIPANDCPTVVVTHFLPSPQSIARRYAGSRLNAYFATDCRALMTKPIQLWIHGHTHSSCDYHHNGVRVVCNPRGYAGGSENHDFQNGLVISVPSIEPPTVRKALP